MVVLWSWFRQKPADTSVPEPSEEPRCSVPGVALIGTFIGVLTIFAEATPMKIGVVAFTTTLMLAEASHAADKIALICSNAREGRLFALNRLRSETRQLPYVRPARR